MTPSPFLIPEEVCDILRREGKFRIQVLLREARAKRIPGAVRDGKRWLFKRDVIERLGQR